MNLEKLKELSPFLFLLLLGALRHLKNKKKQEAPPEIYSQEKVIPKKPLPPPQVAIKPFLSQKKDESVSAPSPKKQTRVQKLVQGVHPAKRLLLLSEILNRRF